MLEPTESTLKNEGHTNVWVKAGDFSDVLVYDDPSISLIRAVTYHRRQGNNVQHISVNAYKDSQIMISFVGDEKLVEAIRSKALFFKLPLEPYPPSMRRNLIKLYSNDKELLATFLEQIDAVVSLETVKNEIFEAVGFQGFTKAFYQELVKQGKIEEVVKAALSLEKYDLLFEVCKDCEEKGEFSQALEIYQAIPEKSAAYSQANENASYLMERRLSLYKDGLELTEEEVEELREFKIRFLLRAANPVTQSTTDKFCHTFSGGTEFSPSVEDIKIDENTVINLLKEIRGLRNQVEKLKNENTSLQKALDLTKARPEEAQSKFSFQRVFSTTEKVGVASPLELTATAKDKTEIPESKLNFN